MNYSDLNQKIDKLLATLTDPEDSEQLHRICTKIRKLIIEAPMPNDLALEISCAYDSLAQKMHQNEPFFALLLLNLVTLYTIGKKQLKEK